MSFHYSLFVVFKCPALSTQTLEICQMVTELKSFNQCKKNAAAIETVVTVEVLRQ